MRKAREIVSGKKDKRDSREKKDDRENGSSERQQR